MKHSMVAAALAAVLAAAPAARAEEKAPVAADAAKVVSELTAMLRPLEKQAGLTWYAASVSGKDEDFAASEAAQNAMDAVLADPALFARVKAAYEGRSALDPELARQVGILYRSLLAKQVDPALLARINKLQSEVEKAFNAFRGKVGGKEVTQNDLKDTLRNSTDSEELKQAWEAQKSVGPVVLGPLLELVDLRNQVAHKLGFRDYYALELEASELDEGELLAIYEELDRLTAPAFFALKAEADLTLSERLHVPTAELYPWHYQDFFFQEPPQVFDIDYDALYKPHDAVELAKRFYTGIGLPVDDVLARSDLYEKPGKSPHAFCADIDREDDVRVLANVVNGFDWTNTMIHELGHAVYDKFKDKGAPYFLRGPSHMLTTEGFAMMLDKLTLNPHFIDALVGLDAKKKAEMIPGARKMAAFGSLTFARWAMVMLHFERAMYADPKQDLNKLWWDLVERYQGLHRPKGRQAPDFASKIHFVVAPVYYQNYMLGEVFGAQVHATIAKKIEGKDDPFEAVYVGNPKVGAYLKEKMFVPGARLSWKELTQQVTGEPLSPKVYAAQFARFATPDRPGSPAAR